MLYLVATPIGNLKDITLRAIEVLKSCDYILCEDTRHSLILLKEYNISTPLKSFHQFNEKKLENHVIKDLQTGKKIGLISDAGTPGICDPGERLVQQCYLNNIPLTSIPGPCAFATALSLCPFPKNRIQFLGFLPKKEKERKELLASALSYSFTTIFYESPHRILQTLTALPLKRNICVLREISKKFEEHILGTIEEVLHQFRQISPKGEFVIILEGASYNYLETPPNDHVLYLIEEYQLSKNEAIKLAAQLRGVPKKILYKTTKDI
jgi:16S rRNA (cytidine1402-2'-O)-methyltransferase